MGVAIFIPARLASSRLPRKVLADISGKSMILHVYDRCKETGIENIFIACDSQEVYDVANNYGAKAILTDPNLPSGTDRVYSALMQIDSNKKFDSIVNVQGDVPNLDPKIITNVINLLKKLGSKADIVTAVTKIHNEEDKISQNVVKASLSLKDDNYAKALLFTRVAPTIGYLPLYEHIGIYAFRRASLERFVNLKPSPLELSEKLEQLRALEDDMNIYTTIEKEKPISVDVEKDLELVREALKGT